MSHYFDVLCFPELEPHTNRVTYRLSAVEPRAHNSRRAHTSSALFRL